MSAFLLFSSFGAVFGIGFWLSDLYIKYFLKPNKMPERKLPETSLAAYRSLDPVRITKTYQIILDALKVIGTGNYEAIAKQATVNESRIWKRLSEMESAGLIYKPGTTVTTKSGRQSFQYSICNPNEPKIEKKTEKVLKGKSVSDYSKTISSIQANLF